MPTIRVDDDVYAVLTSGKSHGLNANSALRAALGLSSDPSPQPASHVTPAWPTGRLRPLVDAGLLQPGQAVTWYCHLRGETPTATITASGHLVTTDGREAISPDAAASAVVGYPCKGWQQWRTSDCTTLDQLRSRYLTQQAVAADEPGPAAPTDVAGTRPEDGESGGDR